LRHASGT